MTKQHDDVFDAVLSGVTEARPVKQDSGGAGARFLKRGNAISDKLSGQNEEKVLHWVDPARCRMWERHNRDYDLLTVENCRDLIDGIRAQGRQEFPAIVRRLASEDKEFEVICGARRHFAVSWLQANNYPQFKYLVEVRDLSDEEAFRLADIENREREDISDYERAVDYAAAVKLYYDGKQKAMAERLEVSTVWLSRYLDLARLPEEIVRAFASVRDIRELHARVLKPLMKNPKQREAILSEAARLEDLQSLAGAGQGAYVNPAAVVNALKAAAAGPKPAKPSARVYRGAQGGSIRCTNSGRKIRLEFDATTARSDLETAFAAFLDERK
ncbi:MAG: ParB/RepB/Spo0J family partition protein [Pseudomonadota bacterium]